MEIPTEASNVLRLNVQPCLRDHRVRELRHGSLQVQPRRGPKAHAQIGDLPHERKVLHDVLDHVRVAHLDHNLLPAEKGSVDLRDRAGRERHTLKRLKVGVERHANGFLHFTPGMIKAVRGRLRVQTSERSAQRFREHVWAHGGPLPPLDEGGARPCKRGRHKREVEPLAKGSQNKCERQQQKHGREDGEQGQGAHRQLYARGRWLVDER
mmetsp:Transcript_51985/g.119596  ORF Transcript_51985/g.119596 Transcript_51985/m.119596 type:complete len:210 (-) Transcript_51985:243-872(-)